MEDLKNDVQSDLKSFDYSPRNGNYDLKKSELVDPEPTDQVKMKMTFGEKLVGLTFNPSGDDKVGKAKRLCADLADLLASDYDERHLQSELQSRLFNHAVGEILNAQMNVVKVLTLKY